MSISNLGKFRENLIFLLITAPGGTQHFGGIYMCRGQDPQFTSPQSFSSLSIQCQRVAQKLCYSFHIALLLGQVKARSLSSRMHRHSARAPKLCSSPCSSHIPPLFAQRQTFGAKRRPNIRLARVQTPRWRLPRSFENNLNNSCKCHNNRQTMSNQLYYTS